MGVSRHEQHSPEGNTAHISFEEIERAILQISWLSQRQFMQLLDGEQFRLTVPQFYTLLHLQQLCEECKMSDLAEATQQSAASLTGIVDRLLEKNLVERTRHERDRRQVMVVLTPRGSEMIAAIKEARREQIQAALAHLQIDDIDTLMRLLGRVLEGMHRILEGGENGRWA